MTRRRRGGELEESELVTARLFSEKQAAIALLAMSLVAYLAAMQVMLLRVQPGAANAGPAPPPDRRTDIACADGSLYDLQGLPVDPTTLDDRVVVLHLDAPTNACLSRLSDISGLVVGVPVPR
jgi:hypothetical protein